MPSFSADNCDTLNLDQEARNGQTADGDQRAGGKALLENLLRIATKLYMANS